jgi:hypothetical protein
MKITPFLTEQREITYFKYEHRTVEMEDERGPNL